MKHAPVISIIAIAISFLIAFSHSIEAGTIDVPVARWKTPDGIEYGTWGQPAEKPAPTLIMLASTIEATLSEPYFRQCGNELAEFGFMVVSLDIPCHGDQMTEGEPEGLNGWNYRAENDVDFVAQSNVRLSKVLDDLIRTGITDPARIAVGGTSRGGFLAMQFAAHDDRVKCVAAFAPVTELGALREFHATQDHPLVRKLSLLNQVEKLKGRPVWIVIGDRDDRVGTHHAIELAGRLSAAAKAENIASNVELHVLSEPRGHTTPQGSTHLAADWVQHHLNDVP